MPLISIELSFDAALRHKAVLAVNVDLQGEMSSRGADENSVRLLRHALLCLKPYPSLKTLGLQQKKAPHCEEPVCLSRNLMTMDQMDHSWNDAC
jgi:hypothetical protein